MDELLPIAGLGFVAGLAVAHWFGRHRRRMVGGLLGLPRRAATTGVATGLRTAGVAASAAGHLAEGTGGAARAVADRVDRRATPTEPVPPAPEGAPTGRR
jgi:hypothetical protein